MARLSLLLAAVVSVSSAYVYTCNEIRNELIADSALVHGTQACVIVPEAVKPTDEPYTHYLSTTYLYDSASGKRHPLADVLNEPSFCVGGHGPWMVLTDTPLQFKCSSAQYDYAEIIMLFTSEDTNVTRAGSEIIMLFTTDETNMTRAGPEPSSSTYGPGTYSFVAPEGSLVVDKVSIGDGKETFLQWYSGVGASENEERFAMMPERFIPGTSTVVIGPVTTLIVEDDVTVELTLTSFAQSYLFTAEPGFDFTLMTTGRANDVQSSRPQVNISVSYEIDGNPILAPVTYTGTAKFDDRVPTQFAVAGFQQRHRSVFSTTGDIVSITYQGPLTSRQIGASKEVIYLRVVSTPVVPDVTDGPQDTVLPQTGPTRRTAPPTSTTTAASTASFSSTQKSTATSTTMKAMQTTSGASGVVITALIPLLTYFM